jgi:uncharacterized membrane protein
MRAILHILCLVILGVFSWLMVGLIVPYTTFRIDVDFLRTKQNIIHLEVWRYAFYIHVFLSIFALIAGFTQFSKRIRLRHIRLHRTMGYIYLVDVLLLAGPSGLIMSFFANGNVWSKTSFVLLSLLWIFCTAASFASIRRGRVDEHRRWMVRSYALTLSAITFRLYAYLLPEFVRLNAVELYTLVAWLSWTLNLLVAELINYRERTSGLVTAS